METVEGNEVIARFCGWQRVLNSDLWYHETPPLWGTKTQGKFFFDVSYDWLIPAWVKFRDLKFENESDQIKHMVYCSNFSNQLLLNPIFEAFTELVSALKWYQSLKKVKSMKINVYNSPDGQLRWVKEEVPEQPVIRDPKYTIDFHEDIYDEGTFSKDSYNYNQKIERIKKESVPFENHNEIFIELVPEDSKNFKLQPDTFYSFEWSGEIQQAQIFSHCTAGVKHYKSVARLTPADPIIKHKGKETVFNLVPAKQDNPEVKTPALDEVFKDITKGKLDSHYKGEVKEESQGDREETIEGKEREVQLLSQEFRDKMFSAARVYVDKQGVHDKPHITKHDFVSGYLQCHIDNHKQGRKKKRNSQ